MIPPADCALRQVAAGWDVKISSAARLALRFVHKPQVKKESALRFIPLGLVFVGK